MDCAGHTAFRVSLWVLLPAAADAYPHVGRLRVLACDLLRPQSRGRECARGRRAGGGGGQWPADCKPHSHCVCVRADEAARCSGVGRAVGGGGGEGVTGTDVHEARLLAQQRGRGLASAPTSGQSQSLAVAAPASACDALDHHPPPPANSSASLFLTRPAFVCVLCICCTHPLC